MKKMFNKAVLNGTTIMGDGLTYPRIPNVYTGGNEGGYQRGDMMDANAVVEMIKELTDTGKITIDELKNLINEEIQERVEGDQDQQRYTDEKIKDLIGTSPETLDTLKEIADALGEDPDFAANVWNKIAELTTKHNEDVQELQDAITSGFENIDFTPYVKKTDVVTSTTNGLMLASDKTKLDAFEEAKRYVKAINLPDTVLNDKISIASRTRDVVVLKFNGNNLNTNTKVETYIHLHNAETTKAGVMSAFDKQKLDSLVNYQAGNGIDITGDTISCTLDTSLYSIVTELPETGLPNKIYLLPSTKTEEGNIYTEYGYVDNKWEEIGKYKADVDLSPYERALNLPSDVVKALNVQSGANYVNVYSYKEDLDRGILSEVSEFDIPKATSEKAGIITAQDKVKLDGIETGAQVNKIESVSVNGTPLEITNKGINIPNATTEKDGMMSANDKSKLDYLANEETLAYGVEWDTTSSDPHLTRIGNMSFHKTLPIQSLLKGCISLKDKVIYWLNESDWRFKKDPETISISLTVDGGYSLVSDIFSTLRYEKQWVKIGGVACQIGSINTNTNTATLVANDQLNALGLVTGTQNVELGAVLNGYDGTVRVYCPDFYIKSVIDGTKRRVWISTIKIDNSYTHQPEILIDAYRSTVLNAVPSNMGYLSTLQANSAISVVNTHDYCRGGGNRSANDAYLDTDPSRSDLCKPRTDMPRSTMRTYSRNAGSETLSYDLYKNIFYWLYVIEYANFNCQEAYNEAVTAEGYKQGGLGAGVTTINNSHWDYYNNYYPLTPCGYCNELGNGTGLKTMTVVTPTTSGGDPTLTYNFSVPRWRGFDNPFGDIWTNLDGIIIQGDAKGNPKTVYTTTDPNNYGDNESAKNAMEIAGHEIHQNGYTKEFDLGEAAHIIPESVGGDTTKYKCDYHWTGSKDTSLRTLLVGGHANTGTDAGLGHFDSHDGVSDSHTRLGFRSVSAFVSFSE